MAVSGGFDKGPQRMEISEAYPQMTQMAQIFTTENTEGTERGAYIDGSEGERHSWALLSSLPWF
jgi:hypothetical protein